MIESTSESHFASASSSLSAIRSGSLQRCQNVTSWVSISSSRIGKNHRWRGPVSRECRGSLSCSYKPKTPAQRATREPQLWNDAGPRICFTTCLDVCSGCFSIIDSERRNRLFLSQTVLVEQIPYSRCLKCQTFATFAVVVPVEGRQERSSSSTDTRLFFKRLNHS